MFRHSARNLPLKNSMNPEGIAQSAVVCRFSGAREAEDDGRPDRGSEIRCRCGHGVGRKFHEEPQVLHYGRPGTLEELVPGMTFTIEPMINAGKPQTRLLPDGWTVVTRDHSLSAQWEHTLAVTETGFEILTPWPNAA